MGSKFNLRKINMYVANLFSEKLTGNSKGSLSLPTSVISNVELITPQRATEMLNKSGGNRKIREDHVIWLAQMMDNGSFKVTHQGVAFSKNGLLIDGHHRLRAVILADKNVSMMVTYGLDDVYDSIDQGANRSRGDILNLDCRVSIPLTLATEMLFMRKKANIAEMKMIMETPIYQAILEVAEFQQGNYKYFTNGHSRLAVAVMLLDSSIKNKEYVKNQYRALCVGNFDEMCESVRSYYRQTVTAPSLGRGVSGQRAMFAKLLKVLNPQSANLTKIVLRNDSVEQSWATGRSVLNSYLNY